jgi:hypothetical protein
MGAITGRFMTVLEAQMEIARQQTRMSDFMRAVRATGKGNNVSNGNWASGVSPGFGFQPGPKTRNVEPKEAEGFFKDLMEEVKAARQVMNELQKTVEAITGKSNGQGPSFNVYANLAFLRKRAQSSIEARIEVSEVGDQGPTLVRNHLMQLNEDSDVYYQTVSDINLSTLRITYKLDTTGNAYVIDKVESGRTRKIG